MSSDERVVSFRPRTIVTAAALLVAVGVVLWVVWVARRVLVWTFVSAFLAVALSPAVDTIQRRGVHRRGGAAGIVYLIMFAIIAGLGALFIPTLVDQVNEFVDAAPGYVEGRHGRPRATRLPRDEVPHRPAGPGRRRRATARGGWRAAGRRRLTSRRASSRSSSAS